MRPERLVLAALILLLLAGSALAARDGRKGRGAAAKAAEDESAQALLADRSRMKEEYLKVREERRLALEATLVRNAGGAGPVASISLDGPEAGVVLAAEAEETPTPTSAPASDEDHFFLYVVGCGMVLGLLLKVVGPTWLNAQVFRIGRRRKRVAAGAMTVQLRPRHQRRLSRS